MSSVLLTVVAFSVIIGGIVWTAQAADAASNSLTDASTVNPNGFPIEFKYGNNSTMAFGDRESRGWPGYGGGGGCYSQIQVSEEFKQNVVNIAENDTDVQNLLAQGYNSTSVRPLISSVVEGKRECNDKGNQRNPSSSEGHNWLRVSVGRSRTGKGDQDSNLDENGD